MKYKAKSKLIELNKGINQVNGQNQESTRSTTIQTLFDVIKFKTKHLGGLAHIPSPCSMLMPKNKTF